MNVVVVLLIENIERAAGEVPIRAYAARSAAFRCWRSRRL